jgi:hypothetical protein
VALVVHVERTAEQPALMINKIERRPGSRLPAISR